MRPRLFLTGVTAADAMGLEGVNSLFVYSLFGDMISVVAVHLRWSLNFVN